MFAQAIRSTHPQCIATMAASVHPTSSQEKGGPNEQKHIDLNANLGKVFTYRLVFLVENWLKNVASHSTFVTSSSCRASLRRELISHPEHHPFLGCRNTRNAHLNHTHTHLRAYAFHLCYSPGRYGAPSSRFFIALKPSAAP